MNNHFEIFNETSYDLEKYIVDLEKLLNYALEKETIENAEFSIIFVDKDTIHELNKNYRNVDRVTDVISFALEDNKTIELSVRLLGDIYICVEKIEEQAIEYGHSFQRELSFLAIHGLLHLLGYDHMNEEDEKVMFNKQDDILDSFGIHRD
ncbi:MAG: rRNA maturation RNase YbeY [Firmicutes bacterium]|nr:rRNA maturation RNase YbeY [Bacillota bacterium]